MTDDIRSLVQRVANADEVSEDRHFTMYRNGSGQRLSLTLSDGGQYEGSRRYQVTVEGAAQGDNTRVAGEPAGTVEEALYAVNWDQVG